MIFSRSVTLHVGFTICLSDVLERLEAADFGINISNQASLHLIYTALL